MHLSTAPALILRPDAPPRATLLWFHGLSVDKETHRAELERFARAGILAVGIDAAGHGERRLPDFEARFAGSQEEVLPPMLELVLETAREIPRIIDALGVPEIAIAGVSMGAFVVYRALTLDPRITTAAALLGSPRWRHDESPDRFIDQFFPKALLSITAEQDVNVPPHDARELHAALTPRYASAPERLRYRELPGAEHLVNEAEWNASIDEIIEWVLTYSSGGGGK
ncbi:MAG TPA: alpha/beta fold hydrolase [Thermoanaerobaculia bacterium]|jgi:hypothetical protein